MHLLTSVIFAFTGTIGVALGISAFGSVIVASLGKAYSMSGYGKDIQRRVGNVARTFLSANAVVAERGDTDFWYPNYLSMELQPFARIEEGEIAETMQVYVLAAEHQYLMSLAPAQWKTRPVMELVYQIMADQPRRRAIVEVGE